MHLISDLKLASKTIVKTITIRMHFRACQSFLDFINAQFILTQLELVACNAWKNRQWDFDAKDFQHLAHYLFKKSINNNSLPRSAMKSVIMQFARHRWQNRLHLRSGRGTPWADWERISDSWMHFWEILPFNLSKSTTALLLLFFHIRAQTVCAAFDLWFWLRTECAVKTGWFN